MVHIVQVMIGDKLEMAGAFAIKEDAYGYLRNNKLIGVVTSMVVTG